MAIVQPGLGELRAHSIGELREYQVLQRLQEGLPDTYQIFHGLSYASVREDKQSYGELDVVVMTPAGSLVILEVKAGDLDISDAGLHKHYSNQRKDVLHQTQHQHASMRLRLRQAGWTNVYVAQFLVLPDQRVQSVTLACPRERIIDSKELPELCSKVIEAGAVAWNHLSATELERLRRFLLGQFDLQLDATARIDQVNQLVRLVSDGLAHWVPLISHPCGQYQIQATAGAGKTQLALRLLADAVDKNQRARYVCFNRPLADHLSKIVSPRVEVVTFHQLARDCWDREKGPPDFHDPQIFSRMAAHYADWISTQTPSIDLLIVDESQDFESEWVASLANGLRADGRFFLMGDDDQAVYERESAELPNAVAIRVDENFRTPRAIVETINFLGLATNPIKPKSPYKGELPGLHIYRPETDPSGLKVTQAVVASLLKDGFALSQIVLLTLRSKANSALLSAAQLGPYRLSTFTGQYDAAGAPEWTAGELQADTVMRFKGCAAPVVVLSGIDFTVLDSASRRKLFVAFTRAQYRLECVLTEAAERALVSGIAAT